MGVDVGTISAVGEGVVGEEAVGKAAASVEDGRLTTAEGAAFVGVNGGEEVQAAREISRRQPFIAAIFILTLCNCLPGFI
jgi:hypothetical protein